MIPVSDHKRDASRAENSLTLSFGSELIGMQRDWNEELQSCREFPHTTPQERCTSLSFAPAAGSMRVESTPSHLVSQ